MAQILLLGLGGTGSRTVNNVAKLLQKNSIPVNNGEMCCAVLDTNTNDIGKIIESGTGVPVYGTSKAQTIEGYLKEYNHLHFEQWCPQSPAFLEESMIDGASELRVKSRIAFEDCIESGKLTELESEIYRVLRHGVDSKIRVMIVSSLSGGTGAGMFIQVALWLRKFLKESQITIRGIFLLPDVFVQTLKDIRENRTTKTRHYCNAYAAIRELNTISKIMKSGNVDLPEKISLGKIFDSVADEKTGKSVFDFAFFVDYKDKNGIPLDSISEYEQMVAQLVYMQLYAPMASNMYSEEDNAFLSFLENEEPLYGACGTAKLEYPLRSVATYCALRASKDAITGGWRNLDLEIQAKRDEMEERKKDGIYDAEDFDDQAEFIRLYEEKTSKTAEETGSNRFFLRIAKEAMNEHRSKGADGKITVKYTDKVSDFLTLVEKQVIDPVVEKYNGVEDYRLSDTFVKQVHTQAALKSRFTADDTSLQDALTAFENNVAKYADTIVNQLLPYNMGEMNMANGESVYGMLTKTTQDTKEFIHPVAARYVVYKFQERLAKELRSIVLSDDKDEALDITSAKLDNKKTSKKESTPEALLNSKQWYQPTAAFLDEVEKKYVEYINERVGLCRKYETNCLRSAVFAKLLERLKLLGKQMEVFFNQLEEVQTTLDGELVKNAAATDGVHGKTVYIYGSAEDKAEIYDGMNLDLDANNAGLNKSVMDSVFGAVCAAKRPTAEDNKKYVDFSLKTIFLLDIVNTFRELIVEDPNNQDRLDLDVYTAICKQSDAQMRRAGKKDKEMSLAEAVDVENNAVREDNSKEERYARAFKEYYDKVFFLAAPMLSYDQEISDNDLGTVTTRTKTFWGFNPKVTSKHQKIGQTLGINAEYQDNEAYPAGELYCYRAVYGLEARYIPKFNELSGGDYYTCYEATVNKMVKDFEGTQGERALVRTPHLDKRWHTILPYITKEKEKQDIKEFFHGFWLAIADGLLKLNKDGHFVIKRKIDSGFGSAIAEDVLVTDPKGKALGMTDLAKLITALQADKIFTAQEIPALEAKYAETLEELVNYDTWVLTSLKKQKEALHPVDIICRYNTSRGRKMEISGGLVGALEQIALEHVAHYDAERSGEKLEEAKYKLCKEILDSSKRVVGKEDIFSVWYEKFLQHKIVKAAK